MARTLRAWSSLKTEAYRYLKEPEGSSYYSADLLLDLFNFNLEARSMQLGEMHEGWLVVPYQTHVIANEPRYTIPAQANSIKRIFWVNPTQQYKKPIERNERKQRSISTRASAGIPSYRLTREFILLEPTPSKAVTNGLQIEIEEAPARLTSDTGTIPVGFPPYMETLLILDTVIMALGIEESQGTGDASRKGHLERLHERVQFQFENFCEQRSDMVEFAQPSHRGG